MKKEKKIDLNKWWKTEPIERVSRFFFLLLFETPNNKIHVVKSGEEGGWELRKNWISPVIDFRNAISYLASRFCDPLKRRSNFPIANLINDKGELWSRSVTPVANIFISRHRFAFSLCPFSSSSSHFLFSFLNENLQPFYLLLPLSFFPIFFSYFIIIIIINTTRIHVQNEKKKGKRKIPPSVVNSTSLLSKSIRLISLSLSSNRIICGSNTKWFFSFFFFFSTPTHLDKRCQVSKEWHVRLPISRSRKMRWEVILFPSGTSKGRRGEMGGDGRDQLIAIVSRHKPTWFTIRASTRNLRRTSTFQFIFIATQTSYRVHIGRHGTANVFVSRIKRDVNGNALASSFFLSFSFFLSPFFFYFTQEGREGEKTWESRQSRQL